MDGKAAGAGPEAAEQAEAAGRRPRPNQMGKPLRGLARRLVHWLREGPLTEEPCEGREGAAPARESWGPGGWWAVCLAQGLCLPNRLAGGGLTGLLGRHGLAGLLLWLLVSGVWGLPWLLLEGGLGALASRGPLQLYAQACPGLGGLGWALLSLSAAAAVLNSASLARSLFFLMSCPGAAWLRCEDPFQLGSSTHNSLACFSFRDGRVCANLNGEHRSHAKGFCVSNATAWNITTSHLAECILRAPHHSPLNSTDWPCSFRLRFKSASPQQIFGDPAKSCEEGHEDLFFERPCRGSPLQPWKEDSSSGGVVVDLSLRAWPLSRKTVVERRAACLTNLLIPGWEGDPDETEESEDEVRERVDKQRRERRWGRSVPLHPRTWLNKKPSNNKRARAMAEQLSHRLREYCSRALGPGDSDEHLLACLDEVIEPEESLSEEELFLDKLGSREPAELAKDLKHGFNTAFLMVYPMGWVVSGVAVAAGLGLAGKALAGTAALSLVVTPLLFLVVLASSQPDNHKQFFWQGIGRAFSLDSCSLASPSLYLEATTLALEGLGFWMGSWGTMASLSRPELAESGLMRKSAVALAAHLVLSLMGGLMELGLAGSVAAASKRSLDELLDSPLPVWVHLPQKLHSLAWGGFTTALFFLVGLLGAQMRSLVLLLSLVTQLSDRWPQLRLFRMATTALVALVLVVLGAPLVSRTGIRLHAPLQAAVYHLWLPLSSVLAGVCLGLGRRWTPLGEWEGQLGLRPPTELSGRLLRWAVLGALGSGWAVLLGLGVGWTAALVAAPVPLAEKAAVGGLGAGLPTLLVLLGLGRGLLASRPLSRARLAALFEPADRCPSSAPTQSQTPPTTHYEQ